MTKLCVTDLIISVFVLSLIEEGRGTSSHLNRNSASYFKILSYLSSVIGPTPSSKDIPIKTLQKEINLLTPADCVFFDEALKKLSHSSVDGLIDLMESLPNVFPDGEASTISPNGVIGLYCICKSSYLGLYIRYVIALWESLTFEDKCNIFEKTIHRINSLQDSEAPISTSVSVSASASASTAILSVWNPVEKALSHGDLLPVESAIHEYFDYGGSSSVARSTLPLDNDGSLGLTFNPLTQALANLHAVEGTDMLTAQTRHQQGMLTLASAWTRNGNDKLAQTAVEEAMKTAHQRGDHTTVAKCLLLLYSIIDDRDSLVASSQAVGPSLSASASANISEEMDLFAESSTMEVLLCKCLNLAAECNLPVLSAQAAILLAKLRSSLPLSPMTTALDHVLGGPSPVMMDDEEEEPQSAAAAETRSNTHASYSNTEDVLSLLDVCTIGVPTTTYQIAMGTYDHQSQGLAAKPGANPQAQKASKALLKPFTTADSFEVSLSIALVRIDFWIRLGYMAEAEFQCRRAIKLFHTNYKSFPAVTCKMKMTEEIAAVCCTLARLKVLCAYPLHNEFTVNASYLSDQPPAAAAAASASSSASSSSSPSTGAGAGAGAGASSSAAASDGSMDIEEEQPQPDDSSIIMEALRDFGMELVESLTVPPASEVLPSGETVDVTCFHCASALLDSVKILNHEKKRRSEVEDEYDCDAASPTPKSAAITNMIHTTHLFVQTRLALVKKNHKKAIRLAEQLRETLRVHNSHSTTQRESSDSTSSQVLFSSEAEAEAAILHAAALQPIDPTTAANILTSVVCAPRAVANVRMRGVLLRTALESEVFRTVLHWNLSHTRPLASAVHQFESSQRLKEVLSATAERARLLCYPSVELVVKNVLKLM